MDRTRILEMNSLLNETVVQEATIKPGDKIRVVRFGKAVDGKALSAPKGGKFRGELTIGGGTRTQEFNPKASNFTWNAKEKMWIDGGANYPATNEDVDRPQVDNMIDDEETDECNEANLSTPQKHQLKIAKDTLKMSKAGANVMGGMNHDEARKFLKSIGYSDQKIKKLEESDEIALEVEAPTNATDPIWNEEVFSESMQYSQLVKLAEKIANMDKKEVFELFKYVFEEATTSHGKEIALQVKGAHAYSGKKR